MNTKPIKTIIMKTTMQEFRDVVLESMQSENSDKQILTFVLLYLASAIEKEKELIQTAYNDGWAKGFNKVFIEGRKYYTDTFK